MRETSEVTVVALDVVHPDTGEMFSINGRAVKQHKYYNIRNLNFKGNIMDLFTYQAELCRSSKDIEMFRDLLFAVDKYNELRVNISDFAVKVGVSRQRMTKFLADAVAIGFMKKVDRGVYGINPFVFRSKGSNNETIEKAQREWSMAIGVGVEESGEENV